MSLPTRVSFAAPAHRSGVWSLVTAAEMRALDRRTIEERGIPGGLLMESAGRSLVEPALALWRSSGRRGQPLRAFCGVGHNGGDGFVFVRHLHAEGFAVEAILVGDPDRLPEDAAENWRRLAAVGAPHRVARADEDWGRLLDETSVAVDALFGTGLQRPVVGPPAALIEALRCARRRDSCAGQGAGQDAGQGAGRGAAGQGGGLRVLAVDLPSGVDADTGAILGTAVEADVTVTISLPKIGLTQEPGRSHAGQIWVARIGIADPPPDGIPRVECWGPVAAAARWPARPAAGHKGTFGHVLVVAGSPGKAGAAALSARGALRAGAGLVTVATARGLEMELAGLCLEAMSASLTSGRSGVFDESAEKALHELAQARDVVVLGPGLGRAPETGALARALATSLERPLVLDADGLFALGGALESLRDRRAPTVLTPHPGEAARLLDWEIARVNGDRLGAARRLAERSGAVVVLKGAGTVVADAAGGVLVIPTGGPLLATGGTGDVLTGVVAALLGSALPAFEAAGLGAWWHGAAADRLTAGRGVAFGLLASELADALPETAAALGQTARNGRVGGEGEHAGLAIRFPGL